MTKDECEIETGKAIEEMRKMIAYLKEENRQLKVEVEDLRAYPLQRRSSHSLMFELWE